MPDFRCTTKCFSAAGGKHRFYREGDLLSVPEGARVPSHFVPVEEYKEPDGPRQSGESADRYSRRQFPPLVAPIDEVKVKRAKVAAQKEKVPGGSKNQPERVDRY